MTTPNRQSTQPATRLEQWHTHDFDEQATLLAGWHQRYTQLSSGAFQGDIADIWCDDLHLFMETTSQALFQSGKLDDDMIAVGIPLHAAQNGLFCGEPMSRSSVHIFSGTDGFEFFSPVQLTMGGIVFPKHNLPSHLRTGRFNDAARLLSIPQPVMQDAKAFMHQIFRLCKDSPALLNSARFQKQLRAAVICCASDILTDPQETAKLDSLRRWKIVQQAREILHRHTDEPISIASLCLEIGVSRRTLQYCFQDTLGINPVAFLRAQRLNGVRRTLKEVESVTEAATTWGFWHFGHFSQEYKKLFGELPSDTLRREHA